MSEKRTFLGRLDRLSISRRPRSPSRLWRDLAWSLWLVPPIMLSPFIILPLLMDFGSAVRSVAETWEIYLWFFLLPWTAAGAAWVRAKRLDRADLQSGRNQ